MHITHLQFYVEVIFFAETIKRKNIPVVCGIITFEKEQHVSIGLYLALAPFCILFPLHPVLAGYKQLCTMTPCYDDLLSFSHLCQVWSQWRIQGLSTVVHLCTTGWLFILHPNPKTEN